MVKELEGGGSLLNRKPFGWWRLQKRAREFVIFQAPTARPIPAQSVALSIRVNEFRRCLEQHQSAGDVDYDLQLGRQIGVNATPTIFVNGARYVGFDSDPSTLNKLIDEKAGSNTVK